ncbi:MAG: hypothetical protein OEY97_08215 [Nitrospirota bacterium]|nr:hypothetical protein [Nitrospirota bacterium]
MSTSDLDKIKRALTKTGHIFEHQIGKMFESKGWMIVPNKFYVDKDDHKGKEIDLVAYRITEVREATAYITVVVIEAKKSAKNRWVFYTKGGYLGDINMHTAPLYYHNEIEEVDRYLSPTALLAGMGERDQLDLFQFPRKAYTFSEVSEEKKTGQTSPFFRVIASNNVYNAIFGVMKAQTSELDFYRNRKIARDEKRFYLVFPLVVFDGELLEAEIDPDGDIELSHAEEIQYVNRYRSPAYDAFYSTNIIRNTSLERYIDIYTHLHDGMVEQVQQMIGRFYENLDLGSFEVLWDRIIDRLHQDEQFAPFNPGNLIPHHYNAEKSILEIYVDDTTLYKTLTTRPMYDFTEAVGKILSEVCGRDIRPQFKSHSKILNP